MSGSIKPTMIHRLLRCVPTETPRWLGPTTENCSMNVGDAVIAAVLGLAIAGTYMPMRVFGGPAIPFAIVIWIATYAAIVQFSRFSRVERIARNRYNNRQCIYCGKVLSVSDWKVCDKCSHESN
jgi:hypothetical protein